MSQPKGNPKDTRLGLEDLLKQRFFWTPSYEIYGGTAGLYDMGPAGRALEKNLINRWCHHFVIKERMQEVRCSVLTPDVVLKASGHTTKFNDFLVTDTTTGKLFRADQLFEILLQEKFEKEKDSTKREELRLAIADVGDYNQAQLTECMQKFKLVSPEGNSLSEPVPFNLMFNTSIGPGVNQTKGFLRPETAQGIFVDFPRLFEFARAKLPFAAAQYGTSYRNEIAPRNGLVRCREFMMAEIEHFCDPEALNDFPKFNTVKDLQVSLWSAPAQEHNQEPVTMTLEEAVTVKQVICHKTMAYFMGRTFLFLQSLGIPAEKIRFRQHRVNEKAHYARDCWDAEMVCTSTGGWLECVGIADRQSFDLTQHAQTSGAKNELNPQMIVKVPLDKPIVETKVIVTPIRAALCKTFKKDSNAILEELQNLPEARLAELAENFAKAEAMIGGKPKKAGDMAAVNKLPADQRAQFDALTTIQVQGHDINYSMFSVAKTEVTTNSRSFIPNVVEPSFGVGRIMTVLVENAFALRNIEGQECRRYLKFPAWLAPTQVAIFPLTNKQSHLLDSVIEQFQEAEITISDDDSSVAIGKKYARVDEVGTPFAVTIDTQYADNQTVTLRERDSMQQVRGTVPQVIDAVTDMIKGIKTWEQVYSELVPEATKKEE